MINFYKNVPKRNEKTCTRMFTITLFIKFENF